MVSLFLPTQKFCGGEDSRKGCAARCSDKEYLCRHAPHRHTSSYAVMKFPGMMMQVFLLVQGGADDTHYLTTRPVIIRFSCNVSTAAKHHKVARA